MINQTYKPHDILGSTVTKNGKIRHRPAGITDFNTKIAYNIRITPGLGTPNKSTAEVL